MRLRPFLLTCAIGTGTVLMLSGCMGKPENAPSIRKKFAEVDQMKKSMDEVSSEIQFMAAEIRRLTDENKELRAIVPGAEGAAPALEKIGQLEQRLARVESMARDSVMANAAPTTGPGSTGSREVADAGNKSPRRGPVDLESAGLAGGLTEPAEPAASQPAAPSIAQQQQRETPKRVATSPSDSFKKNTARTTSPKAALKPGQKVASNPAPAPTANRGGYHVIDTGDTIEQIAGKYGVSTQAILSANQLPAGVRLAKGQQLFIPKS